MSDRSHERRLLTEVTQVLGDQAALHDREASFPARGIQAIHDAGLLTRTVGARHGGQGAGLAQTVTVLRALGQGDPSAALVAAMTMLAHAMQRLAPTWPEDLYARAASEAFHRPVLINELQVEPALGTPVRGGLPATVARPTGDGVELTGHKIFATGGAALHWMVVWARIQDSDRAQGFLVRGDARGVRVEPTWDHLGLRGSRSDDVFFDRAPALATERTAPRTPLLQAWNSLGLPALYLGVADAAREWLVSFLAERTPASLGVPLATLPRFQAAVGEIDAALQTSWTLVSSLAAGVDDGDEDAAAQAPLAKLVVTRAAIGAVEQAVGLVGNNGLTRHHPLERHYRDVVCSRVHTPQDDAIVLAAGRSAFEGRLPVPDRQVTP